MQTSQAQQETLNVRVIQVAYGDDESVEDRVARVADMVRAQQGADLIMLPELWAPGFFTFDEWIERSQTLEGETVAALAAAAADVGAVVHMGSLLERAADREVRPDADPGGRGMWNTAVVLDASGQVLTSYRKIHPFGFGEGEPSLIDPGTQMVTVDIGGADIPEVTVGLATCYDLRFPELFRALIDAGSTLLMIPAAWPLSRVEHWEVLGRARAIENQAFVVQANTGGTHGGVAMGGCSQIISPSGEVIARAGTGEEVIEAELNLTELEQYRNAFPVLADRRL